MRVEELTVGRGSRMGGLWEERLMIVGSESQGTRTHA